MLRTEATKRKPGGANNPHGLGGKSGKVEPDIVNVDIINDDKLERPTGTSAAAGLRRLQREAASEYIKAAKANAHP